MTESYVNYAVFGLLYVLQCIVHRMQKYILKTVAVRYSLPSPIFSSPACRAGLTFASSTSPCSSYMMPNLTVHSAAALQAGQKMVSQIARP